MRSMKEKEREEVGVGGGEKEEGRREVTGSV